MYQPVPLPTSSESFGVFLVPESYTDYGLTRVTLTFENSCLMAVHLGVDLGSPEECKDDRCRSQKDTRFALLRSRLEGRYGPAKCSDDSCTWDERGITLDKMRSWQVGISYSTYSPVEWHQRLESVRERLRNERTQRSEL